MTTLTLHVEDAFAECVREYAVSVGKSMSVTMKELISTALDLVGTQKDCPRNDLSKFWGTMPCTEGDAKRFEKNLSAFSSVEEDMWK